ncbi:MAG: virulence factor SrfB, partial [Bacteroidetes bacterium]|nr:virulence factor SrfB [Bacteroidota bacterium]
MSPNQIISLIANSGVQFHTVKINLGEESEAMKVSSTFGETVYEDENKNKEYGFEIPYYYAKKDKYIVKDAVNKDAIDKETGEIDEDKIRPEFIKGCEIPHEQVYTVRARESIEAFEGVWLPVPYFRKRSADDDVHNGPESWARMWFGKIPVSEKKDDNFTHYMVFALDTKCDNAKEPEVNREVYNIPNFVDAEGASVFICSTNLDINYNFCAREWVDEWIETEYIEKKKTLNLKKTDYMFYYIGLYMNLLKTLNRANAFPGISLHAGYTGKGTGGHSIEVDLVLDIGNSRTCGLLIETTKINQMFNFSDASPLEIRDLTYPYKAYCESFEMRLAFVKPRFGKEGAFIKSGNMDAFKWPSIVRIGREATRHIVINNDTNSNFTMSSPKRYLWDDFKREFPWCFITDEKRGANNVLSVPAIFEGVSESFTSDGKFLPREIEKAKEDGAETLPMQGLTPLYSRKSLMTFVFIELFLHAINQINSYAFRKKHGQEYVPRKLKRIVITCPTAMTQRERFTLRDLAIEAILSLKQSFGESFIDSIKIDDMENIELDSVEEEEEKGLRIIPLPRDVIRPADRKRDWAYDEATCSQLAYVYGEIAHRYKGNANLYFKTVGKKRKGSAIPDQPTVTLASVDIGGGTTDIMVCSYQSDPASDITVLTPDPVFWEGFNLAGDDILRKVIERIILPVIAEEAKRCGCRDTVGIMNILFGPDLGLTSADDRTMRAQFTNQIALPIAYGIIQHASEDRTNETRSFDSFFIDYPRPNQHLIDFIDRTFVKKGGATGFEISKLSWTLFKEGVNTVVKDTVEKMIGDICTVISQYDCDYVLLAGRPTVMPVMREMFLKYLPVPPDRVVQLGNYRIGTWYPFADATGRIKDPKTCVAVGATIALMGGKLNRLEDFRINTGLLRKKFDST